MPQPVATVPSTDPATFSVIWPSDADVQAGPITKSAKSIRVRVTDEAGGKTFGETLFVRPSEENSDTSLTMPSFPALSGRMIATAYTNADGTGPVLASVQARLSFNLKGSGQRLVRLGLAGAVSTLSVTPPNSNLSIIPTIAAGVPTAFYATPFYATPEDVRGYYILMPQGTIHWHTETPELAAVDDNGVVTGLASGTARITATLDATETNSAQTGTTNFVITAPVAPASNNVRTVALNAASLAWDRVGGKLWASVPGSKSVRSIDPITLALSSSIGLGGTPGKIAISDDGKYLYVALTAKGVVRRIDLTSLKSDLEFALGKDAKHGVMYASDIAVSPGASQTLAVTRRFRAENNLDDNAGVALYDNGVARPVIMPYTVNQLAWGADASQLYGLGVASLTPYGQTVLDRITISSEGAQLAQSATVSLSSGFGGLAFARGRLYSSSGTVLDGQTLQSVSGFATQTPFSFNLVCADEANNRVFFLGVQTAEGTGRSYLLRTFDATTLQLSDQALLPDPPGAPAFNGFDPEQLGDLTRWGSKGIAFRTERGLIFLVTNAPGL